jgi:hypothetical protein
MGNFGNFVTSFCGCAVNSILISLLLAGTTFGQIQLSRPKAGKPLPNPMMISASRDQVRAIVKQMLEARQIPLDKEDCNPQTGECTLMSKPIIFIKGITTRSQLEHYCEVPTASVRNWVKGRYTLRIQISPASPKTSQVGIYARFDGLTDGVIGSEWVQLTSKGELEDKLLRCIEARLQGEECKDER